MIMAFFSGFQIFQIFMVEWFLYNAADCYAIKVFMAWDAA